MTTRPAPTLAAVVLPSRGGARLTETLVALRWVDRRVVLAFDDDLLGPAPLPPDVLQVRGATALDQLDHLDTDWILLLTEEERIAPEDAPRIRDAIAAAVPGEVLALRVVTAALDLHLRLGRGVPRVAPRGTPIRIRPGFDVGFLCAVHAERTLDVDIVRSRGTTLTDAVELAAADAAMLAAIGDRRVGRGRGILWHPLVAAGRTMAARAVDGRLGGGRWILAVLEGYRVVVAYAKLWELRRNRAVVLE
jgi:hypothetical protein